MQKKDREIGINLSLSEWLEKSKKKEVVITYSFPTDAHLEEYLTTIDTRTNEEVKALLLQFLLPACHLESDRRLWKDLTTLYSNEELQKLIHKSFFIKHILCLPTQHPWPSIQWIIDLLPNFPQHAISALDSYSMNFCQFLPDGRLDGLSDAKKIIKAKYIRHILPARETLQTINWYDFEILIAYLYKKMKFEIHLTKKTRDGGYDIVAIKNNDRESIRLHIECKHQKGFITPEIARQVAGTLVNKNATKCVIVTSSYFTEDCLDFAKETNRMELINIDNLDYTLREHVSYNWTSKISSIINDAKTDLKENIKNAKNKI